MGLTIDEISKRYNIDIKKLKFFEKNDLIKITNDFSDKDMKRLSDVCTLYDCGMDTDTVKQFMQFNCEEENREKLKFLNVYRSDLLNKIHNMQKNLDNLDFIIYKIKNKI